MSDILDPKHPKWGEYLDAAPAAPAPDAARLIASLSILAKLRDDAIKAQAILESNCETLGKAIIESASADAATREGAEGQRTTDRDSERPPVGTSAAADHTESAAPAQEPVAWRDVHDHSNLYWRKPPQGDVEPLFTESAARSLADKEQ